MVDPFTAVGLASSIAQFIDFSHKLFSTSRKIYTSGSGVSKNVEDLTSLTTSLQTISAKLLPCSADSKQSDVPVALAELALKCHTAATELIQVLQKLALKDKLSKWQSFYAALKTEWKKGKIKDMSVTLDTYRVQLVLQLQMLER